MQIYCEISKIGLTRQKRSGNSSCKISRPRLRLEIDGATIQKRHKENGIVQSAESNVECRQDDSLSIVMRRTLG